MTTVSQAFNNVHNQPSPALPLVRRRHLGLPRSPRWYQAGFDGVGFVVSFAVYYALRFLSGFFQTVSNVFTQPFKVQAQTLLSGTTAENIALLSLAVLALAVYWALLFWFAGLYADWYVRSPFDELFTIVRISFIGCCLLGVLIFLDDSGSPQNTRLLVLLYWIALCSSIIGGRLAARIVQRVLRKRGVISFPVLLLGSAANLRVLADSISRAPEFGFEPIGVVVNEVREIEQWQTLSVRDSAAAAALQLPLPLPLPMCGTFSELPTVLDTLCPSSVFISIETPDHEELLGIANECDRRGITMKIVPDLYEIFSGQTRAQHIYGISLIEVSSQIMTPWQRVVKRLTDIVLSSLALVIGFPVWLAIALTVYCETPGGAFYSQIRIGRNNVPFRIWKFRSMVSGTNRDASYTKVNDARVTSFGRFIRKTHLDEIPQLWNILKGDMSLVGPRPEMPPLVEKFTQAIPYYPRRHKVRPGLTGWWQISSNYFHYEETIESIRSRLVYDFYYIENVSFRLDLEIIVRTIVKVMRGHGRA
jgi:exopolysaccharide biosynthesis polyprenyl glycosylphosphotransferase